jgi:hypothetical protein
MTHYVGIQNRAAKLYESARGSVANAVLVTQFDASTAYTVSLPPAPRGNMLRALAAASIYGECWMRYEAPALPPLTMRSDLPGIERAAKQEAFYVAACPIGDPPKPSRVKPALAGLSVVAEGDHRPGSWR